MDLRELAEALRLTRDDGPRREVDARPTCRNGTITITNIGALGVDAGTPILNPGESAILAFGSVRPCHGFTTAKCACAR